MSSDPTFDPQQSRALVAEASSGGVNAINELLHRYMPLLQSYLRQNAGPMLSGKESNADLAQSVCREVLEQVRGERFEYHGEPEFRRWLMTTALHKLQQRVRYWRALRREAQRDASADVEQLIRDEASPSQMAIQGEEFGAYEKAFSRLPAEHREIIAMVRMEGISHADAAQRLGIPENQSRTLLSRALSRLARIVAESARD